MHLCVSLIRFLIKFNIKLVNLDFTSFITISSSSQISSRWDVVSHKYDAAFSEHQVEKVVLSTFSVKNEAARRGLEESAKKGCSFILPGSRVVAIKVGQSSFGKTYQAVELTSEGAVVPIGEMFSTARALRKAVSIKPDQSGLFQCVDKADRFAKEQKMTFVPLASMEMTSRKLSIPWRQLLESSREAMPSAQT